MGKTTSARRFGIAPLVGTGVSDAAVATPVGIGVSDATVGTLVGTGVSDVTVVTRSAVALGVGVASGSDVHAIIAIAMMPRQVAHNRPEANSADPGVLSIYALQSPTVHYESSHSRKVLRLDDVHVGGGDEDLTVV